jgi:hypothetical protein
MSGMLVGSRVPPHSEERAARNVGRKFPAGGKVSGWCRLHNRLECALKAVNMSAAQGLAEKPDDF